MLSVNDRHLWFTTYSNSETTLLFFTSCFMALKTCYCRWNCVAIMSISWHTCNYTISYAILDLWLPVQYGRVTDSIIETFDPENVGVAVGNLFLASLEAELHLGGSFAPINTNVTKIIFNVRGLIALLNNVLQLLFLREFAPHHNTRCRYFTQLYDSTLWFQLILSNCLPENFPSGARVRQCSSIAGSTSLSASVFTTDGLTMLTRICSNVYDIMKQWPYRDQN